MAENIRSNSAMNNENVGYGDKWHDGSMGKWLNERINGVVDLTNKLEQIVEARIKQGSGFEEGTLLLEIEKISDEKTKKEAMLVAAKKCSDNFIVEEYLYYLREIRDLLKTGYPAGKVFEIVGKVDSKALFNVVM